MSDELTLHLGNPCAFCSGDPCRCYAPPPPAILPPEELLRLGALTLQAESSEAVDKLLDEQEAIYLTKGKAELVEALVARDRLLANQGRQIADGRTGGRLLREFMRAALYRAGGRPDPQAVQRAIEQFEGPERTEIVDARQLRLHGSTLGPLEPPEKVAQELADGTRKQR